LFADKKKAKSDSTAHGRLNVFETVALTCGAGDDEVDVGRGFFPFLSQQLSVHHQLSQWPPCQSESDPESLKCKSSANCPSLTLSVQTGASLSLATEARIAVLTKAGKAHNGHRLLVHWKYQKSIWPTTSTHRTPIKRWC